MNIDSPPLAVGLLGTSPAGIPGGLWVKDMGNPQAAGHRSSMLTFQIGVNDLEDPF